jgi:hypothetical protein
VSAARFSASKAVSNAYTALSLDGRTDIAEGLREAASGIDELVLVATAARNVMQRHGVITVQLDEAIERVAGGAA